MKTGRSVLAAVLLPFLLFCGGCARRKPSNTAPSTAPYDGVWWSTAGSDERTGFLHALEDCLTFDAKPQLIFDGTWGDYEMLIGAYYDSRADRSPPVQRVFEGFGKRSGDLESSKRYGNEFWRSHNEASRRGFVEGHFECEGHTGNSSMWTRELSYYVGRLNDAYNADDRHGEDAPEYTGSVASALHDLRDQR